MDWPFGALLPHVFVWLSFPQVLAASAAGDDAARGCRPAAPAGDWRPRQPRGAVHTGRRMNI